ncbi:hypothetical protein [Aquimarina litoralis]
MKNLLNLKGAKVLNRKQQTMINGGFGQSCSTNRDCSNLGCGFVCTSFDVCFKPNSNNC